MIYVLSYLCACFCVLVGIGVLGAMGYSLDYDPEEMYDPNDPFPSPPERVDEHLRDGREGRPGHGSEGA